MVTAYLHASSRWLPHSNVHVSGVLAGEPSQRRDQDELHGANVDVLLGDPGTTHYHADGSLASTTTPLACRGGV